MVIGRWRDEELNQDSLDLQRRERERLTMCVKRQNGKESKKGKGMQKAESPWPPACNLQSADGEARDEEVHSVHF